LFLGSVSFSAFRFGASSSCTSYGDNPPPCTPTLQQVVINNPLAGGPLFLPGLIIVLLAIPTGLPAWIVGPILAQRRGASSRTAILIVAIIASALGIVSLVAIVLISPALATPETCISSTGPGSLCFSGGQAKLVALLGIGFGPLLASLLVGMPAWVMALTETTRRTQWGWFIVVLLVSPIGAMLYGFLGAQPHPHPPAVPPASTLAAS
jgi:hypothetical protein